MFFMMEGLEHSVRLHPSNMKELHKTEGSFTKCWKDLVCEKVSTEVEHRFDSDLGYVVELLCIKKVGEGIIQPQTGMIEHKVVYDAVVQFPLEGEVIDAVVYKVKQSCIIFCFIGLIYGIVNIEQFPVDDDYDYTETVVTSTTNNPNKEEKTIRMFVSAANPEKVIRKGAVVRLRIVQRTYGNKGFWLQGSMKNKFLGLKENAPLPLAPIMYSVSKRQEEDDIEISEIDKKFLFLDSDADSSASMSSCSPHTKGPSIESILVLD